MYIYMYVWYVRDSVYLCDLLYLSGALSQVWARDQLLRWPGYEAWVRGQEHISCCTWHINELNCKTMDRQERLRQRSKYERT